MADLFDLSDLAAFLQSDLDAATATVARKVATGLIAGEVGQSFDPWPDDLSMLGLGIAARLIDNPAGRATEAVGAASAGFGSTTGLTAAAVLSAEERNVCRRYRNRMLVVTTVEPDSVFTG